MTFATSDSQLFQVTELLAGKKTSHLLGNFKLEILQHFEDTSSNPIFSLSENPVLLQTW